MLITVDRYLSTAEATLSRIFLGPDNDPASHVHGTMVGYGVEDEPRAFKVSGETRIPAGTYKITLRTFGRLYKKALTDRRFRDFNAPGMLWVKDVPGFEHILIHWGNDESETEGCLLVGMERNEARMTVQRSAECYEALYKRVVIAAQRGALSIQYIDNDKG